MASPSTDEILALEHRYWDAIKAKDGARTAELSADGAIVTGASGIMSIPKAKMGQMTEEGQWKLNSYEFEDVKMASPSDDVAIIAYVVKQNVTMNGETKDLRAADSSTWIRGAGGWECHAHSETFLQDKKPN